jgi:hypothetical protein
MLFCPFVALLACNYLSLLLHFSFAMTCNDFIDRHVYDTSRSGTVTGACGLRVQSFATYLLSF